MRRFAACPGRAAGVFGRLLLGLALAACATAPAAPTTPAPVRELVLYNWADYMPAELLAAFTAATQVPVRVVTYTSTEAAIAAIQAGLAFDVAVVDNDQLPVLVAGGYLAEIDLQRVPNFRNISPNFRDLATDPANRHSVPFNWGTTGLLVRTDRVTAVPQRWADLWDPAYAGRVCLRTQPVEVLSVALQALGYRLDTDDPAELAAAAEQLRRLDATWIDTADTPAGVRACLDSAAALMVGWPADALEAQARDPAVAYLLPADGGFLWGDSLVIAAGSLSQTAAEQFIDFVLRPAMSALVVETYSYATANEAALALVDPALLGDTALFPPRADLERAHWYPPLSPLSQERFDEAWRQLTPAGP